MSKIDLGSLTIPELRERYLHFLLQQWEYRSYHDADGRPDVRPWNRLADKIEKAHRALKARGDEGVDAILALIHHPNRNVRYTAIVHCLRQRTDIVLPELQAEQDLPIGSPMALNFSLAYDMWLHGEWLVD